MVGELTRATTTDGGSPRGGRVAAQSAAQPGVPPLPVPEVGGANRSIELKPSFFQGFLICDVLRMGARLNPLDRSVAEEVITDQDLSLTADAATPPLGQ